MEHSPMTYDLRKSLCCPSCGGRARAASIARTRACDACGAVWQTRQSDEACERLQHRSDVAALREAVSCGVLDIEVAERVIARLDNAILRGAEAMKDEETKGSGRS